MMQLNDILKHIEGDSLPPVHLWNPDHCGDIDVVIKRDGSWHYCGSPIGRARMVRLFSRVLRREKDGSFLLVTPVEKLGITVEDAPFVTKFVDFHGFDKAEDQAVISFETNVGDKVVVDADHPIRVHYDSPNAAPQPYVMVRAGLEARISRSHFYELVNHGAESDGGLYIKSSGESFCLGQLDAGDSP